MVKNCNCEINFPTFPKFQYIGYFISWEIRFYFMMCNKSQNNFPSTVNKSIEKSLVKKLKMYSSRHWYHPQPQTASTPSWTCTRTLFGSRSTRRTPPARLFTVTGECLHGSRNRCQRHGLDTRGRCRLLTCGFAGKHKYLKHEICPSVSWLIKAYIDYEQETS